MTRNGIKRFTWVDWTLLSLALLLLCGILGGMLWLRPRKSEKSQILYTVFLPGVRAQWLGDGEPALRIGLPVTSENGTAPLGTVIGITSAPGTVTHYLNGSVWEEERPGSLDLLVEVQGEGNVIPGEGIRICDIRIAAGGEHVLRVGSYYFPKAIILKVEVKNGE